MEDLLGRDPIKVNMQEIYALSKTKGHGNRWRRKYWFGSLPSDRKLPSKQLIIFDIYENNAYDIQQELKKNYPELDLVVLIGSVRDSRRINTVFESYRPDVVYHAAAHKHVPLMEDSPCESIKNNVIGTYKTAYAAMMNGCQRFVLISTDKAVNPTNIMGASKRLCEMIVQSFDRMVKEKTPEKLPILYAHADDEDGAMVKKQILSG
ncbi:MAG: polysaccharide biosynthesis protein, partial [Blautia sp.]